MERSFSVVRAQAEHVKSISDLSTLVYPGTSGWAQEQLANHQQTFPEGQLVAVETETSRVVGASLNLIVSWGKHPFPYTYKDLIDHGWFGNHSQSGRFLYVAELMVHPEWRGHGVGYTLVEARMKIAQALGLVGTRGSAHFSNFDADVFESPEHYIAAFIRGEVHDAALSFHLRCGASFIGVLRNHFDADDDKCPHAVIVEILFQGGSVNANNRRGELVGSDA